MIGILSTHMSQNFPGSVAAGSIAAHRWRGKRSARALSHRMGGPSKAGSAFPANMSKQGLSARLYAPNQTLIMVKAELPQCGGSEVLFTLAARPLRELLSQNHTRIMDFQCPFGSEVRFLWLPQGQRTSQSGHSVYFGCVKRDNPAGTWGATYYRNAKPPICFSKWAVGVRKSELLLL